MLENDCSHWGCILLSECSPVHLFMCPFAFLLITILAFKLGELSGAGE